MAMSVLVADDDKNVRELIRATLGDDPRYQLLLAKDGQEALELARSEKPNLVFLDIMMPKMDGIRVCQRLKSDLSTMRAKVVMLSALSCSEEREEARAAGADGYFTKRFSLTALLETVEEVLFGGTI